MRSLGFVTTVGSLVLGSLAVQAAPAQRAVPEVAVAELGQATFGDAETLPLVSQTMAIEIDGQHARTVSNLVHRNAQGGRVEGLATLELDESARITGFSYWNGGQRILGEVLPKSTARAIYDETVGRRRDPGLLEEVAPGRFQLNVYPIEPKERKRSQFVWEQWLEQHAGEVSYRAPLAGDAEITIELTDDRGISDLRSSSHELTTETANGRTRITARPRSKGVRELELAWRIGAAPMTLHGWVHRDAGADGYVLFHVAAPRAKASARVAKDVTLVLDESGSMAGEALDNGKAAAAAIVGRLEPDDRLNVVLFDDRVESLFSAPKAVTEDVRKKARRFIDGAGNGGGTDVAAALTAALARQNDDARPKSVLLLTDGESPREPAFAAAQADAKDVRLFTIGVGPQVDTAALQQLAALKRGRYTPIASASEIRPALAELYDRMAAPVFVGLSLSSEGPTMVRTYPATLPDLFAGDELVIVARVQGSGELEVQLTGMTTAGRKSITGTLAIPKAKERPWVGSMWARARIQDLLTRLQLETKDSTERIDEVTRLGVAYDIVTPYTSFLAIPESELTEHTRSLLKHGREGQATGRIVDLEEFRNIPVGNSDRDFTSIVESTAADSSGVSLAGTTGAPDAPSFATSRALDSESAPRSATSKAGCAHCSAGDDGAPAWLVVGVMVMTLRRRRSARAA